MPEFADTIYFNCCAYTMDADRSVADAFAVSGDRFVAAASAEQIMQEFRAREEIDLGGKTVLPGFIDAHGHLIGLGRAKLAVDLADMRSEEEVSVKLSPRIRVSPPGAWIRGRGWDQHQWIRQVFPSRASLDAIAAEHPVYLTRVDSHACWVNTRALELARVSKETRDPDGGRIVRDAHGEPTGVLIDAAMDLVSRFLPEPTDREMRESIRLAMEECVSFGLTSVHDMGMDAGQFELYKKMIDEDCFPVRVYGAVGGPGTLWERLKNEGTLIGYGNNKLTVRALKLFIDGALGSHGAALMEPYTDAPDNLGLTLLSGDVLQALVNESVDSGFQVCTHAIGDRANSIVLDAYEAALRNRRPVDHRLRVEHAQILAPEDIPRFKQLGVLPSMQQVHCISDMYWAESLLGPTRIRGAYAWRSLLNSGVIIPGGSDFPVESPDPILGIYAACTRRDTSGRPRTAEDIRRYFHLSENDEGDRNRFLDGWYGREKMTREEAVNSFTTWAAYAAFEENMKGSIEKGKLADFIVLSNDIFTVPDEEITRIRVDLTVIGGSRVFSREG